MPPPPTNCNDFSPFPIAVDRARVRFRFQTAYIILLYIMPIPAVATTALASPGSNNNIIYLHIVCWKYPLDIISFHPSLFSLLWIPKHNIVLITIILPPRLFFWHTPPSVGPVLSVHIRNNNINIYNIYYAVSFDSLFVRLNNYYYTRTAVVFIFETI